MGDNWEILCKIRNLKPLNKENHGLFVESRYKVINAATRVAITDLDERNKIVDHSLDQN